MSTRPLVASNASDAAGRFTADFLLPVVAVSMLGATAATVGAINAIGTAAFLLLSIPIGLLVDRLPARGILVGAAACKVAALLVILTQWLFSSISLWGIYATVTLIGVSTVATETAQSAAVVRVAGVDNVSRLYSRLQSVDSAASIIAPGAAGLLFGLSPFSAILLSAMAFIVSLLFASRISAPPIQTPSTPTSFGQELLRGINELRRNKTVRHLTILTMIGNAGLAVGSAVDTVYILSTLTVPPDTFGLIMSIGSAGALAGSLLSPKVIETTSRIRLVIMSVITQCLLASVLPLAVLLPMTQVIVLLSAQALLWGFVLVISNVAMASWSASIIDPAILGRTAAAARTFSMGIVPVASILGGLSGKYLGILPTLAIWIGVTVVNALCAIVLLRTRPTMGPATEA